MGNNLTKVLGTSIKVEVTKEDLVAVQVAEIESKLVATRKDLEKKLEENEKKQTEVNKRITKSCKAAAETDANEKMHLVMKEAARITGEEIGDKEISVVVESNLPNSREDYDESRNYISYKANSVFVKKIPKKKENAISFAMDINVRLAVPEDVLDSKTELKLLVDTGEELASDLYKIKRALSDMPAFERQAKAKIARKVIEATEGGQEIDLSELFKITGFTDVKLIEG